MDVVYHSCTDTMTIPSADDQNTTITMKIRV
jgi:hypothetical protein